METGFRTRALCWPGEAGIAADLVARAFSALGPNVSLHPGDLFWRGHRRNGAGIRLALDLAGDPVAVLECDLADSSADFSVTPDRKEEVEPRVIEWLADYLARNGRADEVCLGCFDGDGTRGRLLTSLGFRASNHWYDHFLRPLDALPRAPAPARGYAVRPLVGDAEIRSRTVAGRLAFGGSGIDPEVYERIRAGVGFDPELDLAAFTPDGDVAAFALAWYDPRTRVGEFEPVGTHPDHRRRGLAGAVMAEGLRRLRERGATAAIVYTGGANTAARALYESLGFTVTGRDRDWTRPAT